MGNVSGIRNLRGRAVAGTEEYPDSEKYEIRVRRHDAPGNITAEITRLNRIRKSHSALHSHLGLRFYPAHTIKFCFTANFRPIAPK